MKTLIQVGKQTDDTYAINTGMHLEIIPAKNPYPQTTKSAITFKFFVDNKSLGKTLMIAWNKLNGNTTHQSLRSGEDEKLIFWLIKMVDE